MKELFILIFSILESKMVVRSGDRPNRFAGEWKVPFQKLVGLILFVSYFVVSANAGSGDLDPQFGIGGKVKAEFYAGYDAAFAVAVQTDGKIVAAGATDDQFGDQYMSVMRFNADGTLDGSFGSAGKVLLDILNGQIHVDLVIQPDGKIIVGGTTFDSSFRWDFAIARLEPNGQMDLSFGTGGKVIVDFAGNSDELGGIALQNDGKIVAAGTTWPNGFATDIAVVRLDQIGNPDPSFGVGGKIQTDLNGGHDRGNDLAVQPDGKIVVVGKTPSAPLNFDFALIRYDASGNLDPGFGTGGIVITDFFGEHDEANSVAIQTDGRIVVAGGVGSSVPTMDFGLARYDSSGVLDGTFGNGGKVRTDFYNAVDQANEVVIQPDGKIVAAGRVNPDTSNVELLLDFGVARYLSNGDLDPSFGGDGTVSTDFSYRDEAGGVALQQNCRIVVAGHSWNVQSGNSQYALAQYESDGCSEPPPPTSCPRGQGYWKNHPEKWPVDSLFLGNRQYGKAEMLALLRTPARGNASIILAYQLIAAKLNLANGSDPASAIDYVVQADSILGAYLGPLPYMVTTTSADGQTLAAISGVLDDYNNGLLTSSCNN